MNKGKNKKSIFLWVFGIMPVINLIASFSYYHFPGQSLISFAALLFISLGNSNKFDSRRKTVAFFFVVLTLFVILLSYFNSGALPPIGIISGVSFGILCILLKDEYRITVFNVFIKTLCVLLAISLIEYYVFLLFGNGIELGVVYRSDVTPYYHLLFNVIKIVKLRFQSLAVEPGDIGTLCGFLLFVMNDVKRYSKEFVVIILAGLTSLSLAFYVFLTIYFLWNAFERNLKQVSYVILFLLFIGGLMQDRIQDYIVERYLEEDYDDRSNDDFDRVLVHYLNTSDAFFGKGYGATDKNDSYSNVVGIKRELYEIGVFGVLLIIVAFSVSYFKVNRFSKYTIVFFAVFWLSYYQRSNIFDFSIELVYFSIGAISVQNQNVKKLLANRQSIPNKNKKFDSF